MRVDRARAALFAMIVAAWLAFGATQALAATEVGLSAGFFGTTLVVADKTDDNDAITVSVSGGTITVTEAGTGGVTPGPECAETNPTTVTCPLDPPDPAPPAAPVPQVGSLELSLEDGTDSFTNLNLDVNVSESEFGSVGSKTVNSGPGDDQILTTDEGDVIDTGPGSDFAVARGGNDLVDMGPGDDFVQEEVFSNGADVLDGGPGLEDGMNYGFGFFPFTLDLPLTLTLNGIADDGHAGEGDNLLGFENLTGAEGDDTIVGDGSDNELSGGGGNDTILGVGGDDGISPGSGNDSVDGGEGGDFVDGGDQSEAGADSLNGGGGTGDTLEYSGQAPVTMTLNGQADDGRLGEGDNIAGFEGLRGARGDDTIVGDGASNVLVGNAGDDTITGGAGNDAFDGGGGDDVLLSLGGRDDVECGIGFDTAVHDAVDVVAGGCERRGAEVTSDNIRANRKGKVKVRVACPREEDASCAGRVALISNGRQIGGGRFKATEGKSSRAIVRLTRKGRRILAKADGSLLVAAEARTAEPQGISANARQVDLKTAGLRRRRR